MKVLFIGDIVGKTGRQAVKSLLPNLASRYKIDAVIANGENAAGGFGITEKTAEELFNCGVHIITTGNHVWDKKEAVHYISKENRILRPLNYPPGVPGYGSIIYTLPNKEKIAVMNISGRVFMNTLDCPFRSGKAEAEKLKEAANVVFIDFHAEATSEKIAFGYYMDGIVSAVIGTHTHVQTADEKILSGGTAYITDAGMTGPQDSVIGIEKEQIVERFLSHMPRKYDVAGGKGILSGVIIEIDEKSGKATAIQRLQLTNP
ncbi:MAG: metallophosphoesterase [Nitrospirae bacterium GWC2_46_6]|nr:MAG: metallophosphoesterase [Nitrospirae bacterium GWC2_46_6]OGW24195.1 MAG: metallophosphoesterase [Nitrospirae bacterium GWB2_47_37]